MKQFLSILLLSVSFHVQAQQSATDVLNAEKSFAAYSVQHGTKAAFLQFADSSGLVFERGKPVKAIEFWSRRQEGAGILNWYPVYGWLSQSGDLGFTTGPWTFQPKTINDSVVARGQFNTVWHKTEDGNWKFLLDMGVSKTPDFATKAFAFRDTKINFTPGTMEELLQAEERLVQNAKESGNRNKGYSEALSSHAFLLVRNGHLPTTAVSEIEPLLTSMPLSIAYRQEGAVMAKSADLGYVYGTTTIGDKDDNYLRVWRREGHEWKLVLEVLQY